MTNEQDVNVYSDGNLDANPSSNPNLMSVVEARYSRRFLLWSGMAATAAMLTACGDDDQPVNTATATGSTGASSGKVITLTGASSAAASTGAWTQTSGPAVSLTNASSNTATFLAPSVASATPLGFRFTASGQNGQAGTADTTVTVDPARIDFAAVPKNLNDIVTVPAGYNVTVLYRLGDPIAATTPAYANNGTDTTFSLRAGDHHDGMSFFGLAATGTARDDTSNTRGVLVLNHENISQRYLHPNGATTTGGVRPEAEALKEMEAHGVSVIEVVQTSGTWSYVQGSSLNRRITPLTPVTFRGPVAGSPLLRTAFSPTGVAGRGTINNCAGDPSRWGTFLTNEENWAGYFRRAATDARTAKEVVAFNRYGMTQGAAGNYGWATVTPADPSSTIYSRWNASALAGPADGTGDFRNEPNQFWPAPEG